MSSFASLMALSATQTRQSQDAVQSAIIQRQRREEAKRKQQEEQERKQRELDAKLRLKHFEDEKREQERQARLEEEQAARERAIQRREEEQRDALRYGPKKSKAIAEGAPKWPTSNSHSRDEVRRRRLPSDDDGDSTGGSPGLVLTREEKRERKLQAEMSRAFRSKRSTHAAGYGKAGRRLPGGALDVTATAASSGESTPQSGSQSVKARIAAIPNTLTKLNVVKRDTRTIDEILQDRAKARETKVLDGEEAREFNDWFGSSKKKEPVKRAPPQSSASSPGSGANTPASQTSSAKAVTPIPGASAPFTKKALVAKPTSASSTLKSTSSSSSTKLSAAYKTTVAPKFESKNSSSSISRPNLAKGPAPKASFTKVSSVSAAVPNSRPAYPSAAKKRPRSSSLSASPPPLKRRASSPNPSRNSISQEIWKLFGKDRGSYVQRDVLSDDEDMEADATILEKEEMRSSRIAKKEEEAALEEEKRHEEEKRRKKKEREMREKRGY